jgi:hypothetical protein
VKKVLVRNKGFSNAFKNGALHTACSVINGVFEDVVSWRRSFRCDANANGC